MSDLSQAKAISLKSRVSPAVDLDEQQRLVRDLGTGSAMILRNHGLLTAGRAARSPSSNGPPC